MIFRRSRFLKTFLVLLLLLFILVNINWMLTKSMMGSGRDSGDYSVEHHKIISDKKLKTLLTTKASQPPAIRIIPSLNAEHNVSKVSTSVRSELEYRRTPKIINPQNITELKSFVLDMNTEQTIYNKEKFIPVLQDFEGVVLLIQVHSRIQYLRLLIDSLRAVRDISQILLVFSHDLYIAEMDVLIKSIDFCPVMQIFYPYSIQLYPNQFPGEDPNDCPRNVNREQATKLKCNNADHPDTYGHYREVKFVQTKHHWFWKIHRVFDELRVTKFFNGPVVLLEEDHYVTPDFLHVLKQMYSNRKSLCAHCNVFTLGTYDKTVTFQDSDKVNIYPWLSSKHNMAMTVDRATWEDMKHCTDAFCDFDDYNWDWSLNHISFHCLKSKLFAMVVGSPRVFHIGECGVHHKGKNCDPKPRLDAVNNLISGSRSRLFPQTLLVGLRGSTRPIKPKPNGGWGDIRDRQLCKSFISDTKQRR